MYKKRMFLIIMLMLFCITPVFASMQSGYIIRWKNFTLRIQFNVNYYDVLRTTENYLILSNEALWDLMTWVYNNKDALENKNTLVKLYVSYRYSREIYYSALELPQDISEEIADGAILSYGEYTGRENFAVNIDRIVSTMLEIPYIPPDNNIQIPAYLISSTTFGSYIPAQFEESHVFKGAMNGEMVNYSKNMRFVLFWDMESAQTYLDTYTPSEYTLEQVTLSKETVFDIFDILE